MLLKKPLLLLFLILSLVLTWIIVVGFLRSQGTPLSSNQVSYGFSFSPHVFAQSGLDWKSSYLGLLDGFNWQWVRVSFYWNQMVKDGALTLDDLWFQINEAEKRNIDVVLVIGAKGPFHPEVYIPEHLTKNFKFGERISDQSEAGRQLLVIEQELIPKLATSSAITYWQVENEPFAGPVNDWRIDRNLLIKEIELVRTLDPAKKPIVLTHPGPHIFDRGWEQLLKLLEKDDVLAVNYFPKTRTPDVITIHLFNRDFKLKWPDFLNIPVYIWGPFSPDFAKLAEVVKQNGKNLWIMEMQAEPYLTNFKEVQGKIFVFRPEDIIKSDLQIRKYDIDHIGLWGANWWLIEEKRGNYQWIESVKKVVGDKTSN